MKKWVWTVGAAGMMLALCGEEAPAAPSSHTVSVTLNYDFTVDNACSASVTTGCVKQFNIYDTTGGGTPVKLFSIPAPSGANSAVTGDYGIAIGIDAKVWRTHVRGDGTDGRRDGVQPKRIYCYCSGHASFACEL